MEEVELKDYLKIILKRKKIIIFTVIIFAIVNLVMSFSLIKPRFKTTAKLMLSNHNAQERVALLELYQGYNIISQVKDELKLRYLSPTPSIKITDNNILEISVTDLNPDDAIKICNSFSSKIQNEERQKYEKRKKYFQDQIQFTEDEITTLKKEREKIGKNRSGFVRIRGIEGRLDTFREEFKIWNEKLDSLREPLVLTPAIHSELINISRETGLVLSGLIGLVIGILIAFIIEYLK
jgi:uncharacterized protein involved in exopolysaccharide biosynthesis